MKTAIWISVVVDSWSKISFATRRGYKAVLQLGVFRTPSPRKLKVLFTFKGSQGLLCVYVITTVGGGNLQSRILLISLHKQRHSFLSFQSRTLFFLHMSHELFVRSSLLICTAVRCSFPNWWRSKADVWIVTSPCQSLGLLGSKKHPSFFIFVCKICRRVR